MDKYLVSHCAPPLPSPPPPPPTQFVPLILCLVLLVLQTIVLPYTNRWANVAEIFTLSWLVILLALGNTTSIVIASKELYNFTLWPIFFTPVVIGAGVNITMVAVRIV